MSTRLIDDVERRRRVVARHHLGATAPDVLSACRDLLALHSSDPATPVLACWARVREVEAADVERALYEDRTLWRLHSVRRTLFVVPADEAVLHLRSTGDALAETERRRVVGWLAEAGEDDPEALLDRAAADVLELLADGETRTTSQLGAQLPVLDRELVVGSGRWATTVKLSSRVLYVLAMRGAIVRGRPGGSWRASQYPWSSATAWFGQDPAPVAAVVARARLVARYVERFGPVTETDLRWWTGWTAAQVRAAVAENGFVAVGLDDGETGWVSPDDAEVVGSPDADGVVALLPGLDPTAMGWKQRGFYLGDLGGGPLYDRNGNVGPTVWAGGRIVGGWAQRGDGEVVTRLLVDVGGEARARVDAEAARLRAWLGDHVVTPRFRTPLERELVSA